MNEISFRERWCALGKNWLASDKDFEIWWFFALIESARQNFFLTLLEKFQQIWSFLENEKWKNGIHDDVWLKIAHFSIQTYLKGDTEKLTIFNQLASGRPIFHFSITKKFKFAEI